MDSHPNPKSKRSKSNPFYAAYIALGRSEELLRAIEAAKHDAARIDDAIDLAKANRDACAAQMDYQMAEVLQPRRHRLKKNQYV